MRNLTLLLLLLPSLIWGQVTDASQTTSINNTIRNITAPGGITKGNVSDRLQDLVNSKVSRAEVVTAAGTDNYTITGNSTLSYAQNFTVLVKFTNANTGSATLNVNSLGAKTIKKEVSTNLSAGDIAAGQVYMLVYDGTNFQLLGLGGGGTVSVDGVTITGDGSPGDPLVSVGAATSAQIANNGSDFASIPSTRANLSAAHDRVTPSTKGSTFAPVFTDFQTTGVKTQPLYICNASFDVTLNQDATDNIPIGYTVLGITMPTYTTTFVAGSGATMITSSGGATIAPLSSEQFIQWSATKTAANSWYVQNGRAVSGSFTEFSLLAVTTTYTNQPAGAQELAAGTTGRFRTKVDLTNFTSIRTVVSVSVVGATNAGFYLEYSTDQSSWTMLGSGSGGDIARIGDAIGASVSSWITLPAGAKADVWLRGFSVAGDGAADPVVGRVAAQVK